jgi:hypothetical protein
VYGDYKQILRQDFFYTCAYCSLTEIEAGGVRFTIDHYEPVVARPELEAEYSNLMWSCDLCNSRKSDLCPPPEARAAGRRFYRADEDVFSEHFALSGKRLNGRTPTGEYTIVALSLNRQQLTRFREIRQRLSSSERYVAQGIAGLRDFPIDRLPKEIKARAFTAIKAISKDAAAASNTVDEILRELAKSTLLDDDPDPASAKSEDEARKEQMKAFERQYGSFRGRTNKG